MDYQQEEYDIQEEQPKRPDMLTILCVLSFISAVYNEIANFVSFAFYGTFQSIFSQMAKGEGMFEDMAEQMGDSWEMKAELSLATFSVGRFYYLIEALLFVASFVGVMKMWKLQKQGFHIYSVAQILMLIFSTIFVINKIGGSPLSALLWTAMFILMYFIHYKKVMK